MNSFGIRSPFMLALPLALSLASCASFNAAGSIQAGRKNLLIGGYEGALGHFQQAAAIDPNYVFNVSPLRESVWTYVGRAYYGLGKYTEAHQALEWARFQRGDDYLARLYLGLTLARQGNREAALGEIDAGMTGLYDWLQFITYNTQFGQFWDPQRDIRSELKIDLAMISAREIDWQRLISGAEWVGQRMEQEIDLARRDEAQELERRDRFWP